MKRFKITYKAHEGERKFTAEYWVNAQDIKTARSIFLNEAALGNLDYPNDGIESIGEIA